MRGLPGWTLLAGTCLLSAAPALAADGVPLPGGIILHGAVDVYGDVNFNLPEGRDNWFQDVGTTGKKGNEFSVNVASIDLSKDPEPVGFHLWLVAGTGAFVVHQAEPAGSIGGVNVWQYVMAASVSGRIPAGNGIIVEAGIMPSFLGFEGFASWTNWTYTRSYSSEFSPYYEAGVRVAYAFDDHFSAQLRVLNGWQSIGDVNNAKSYGAQVAWTYDRWSLTVNGYAGPDLPNDDLDWRFFGDVIATVTPWKSVQFALETSGGTQQQPNAPNANWGAVALYARWTFLPQLAAVVRGEVYRDAYGLISGARQTLTEFTGTLAYTPWPPLLLKLEGRYDHSTANVFTGSVLSSGQTPQNLPKQVLVLLGGVAQF
jgi:Putative beta-barrel porin-2, OmpL-like. bbp2